MWHQWQLHVTCCQHFKPVFQQLAETDSPDSTDSQVSMPSSYVECYEFHRVIESESDDRC